MELAAIRAVQAKTDEQLSRLDERQQRSDERLDIVVNLFERHLREDHGIQ